MFKIKLNKEECLGCGSCEAVCPGNFEMDTDGKAKVIKEEVEELGCNKMAEESCPTNAIVIEPIKEEPKEKKDEEEDKEEKEE